MTESATFIGKYRILEELGHGGFATVYKAVDTTLDREVALKVLDPLLTRDSAFMSRFQQEARMTAKLFHPNIAALFEVGQAEGRHFIAMQYIPGHNLRDVVQQRGLLSFDEIASVVQQIGAALDYAHARGVIHRDVKPGNILLDDSGHATLSDFGIVKALEATTIQTTSGAILGTPSYTSPEQAESKPLDGRSDLYSLGIVAYELCTGAVPFVADTTPSLFYKIVHEVPPPPSQVNARVAGPIEQVLLKAIAKNPDQRYQSGHEFALVLGAAFEQAKGEFAQSLYEQARPLLNSGEFDAAEANLREVLAIQPDHRDAQALLDRVLHQREAARRYRELVSLVNQARVWANDLKQFAPDQADPEGVLQLLTTSAGPPTMRAIRQPTSEAALPQAPPGVGAIGTVLLIGSIVAIAYGASFTSSAADVAGEGVEQLKWGNVLLGLGTGLCLGSVIMLWLSGRTPDRPRASTWLRVIGAVLFFGSIAALASGALFASNATDIAGEGVESLKWGNVLLGLGAATGLCSVILLWLSGSSHQPARQHPPSG
jgi:serine/threonine protein kinase